MAYSIAPNQKGYRPEIDGLRAFAVLSVVLFHLSESLLPGGYIGVDIFFVISGFLISNHLLSDINTSRFSFRRFYLKRARRILPALYVLIIVTVLFGSFFLLPADSKKMAKIANEALTYKANYYFAYYADYFAPNTAELPFLHLWSLSVEEQFYFLLPALFFVFYKAAAYVKKNYEKSLVALLVGLFLLSLFWSEYCLNHEALKKLAFYDSGSRACEFLIGSILAVMNVNVAKKLLAEFISITGFLILLVCLFQFDSQTRFPGVWSLLPCLGAGLIILGTEKNSTLVRELLSLKPVVFVGVISYSLYLYHWPLMAVLRYSNSQFSFTKLQMVILFVAAFALAVLSWRFVELPFRKPSPDSNDRALIKVFLIPTVVLFLSLRLVRFTFEKQWFLGKDYEKIQNTLIYLDDDKYCHNRFDAKKCIFGTTSAKPNILLIGDSHAGHYQPFLDEVGKQQNFSFLARSYDACIPVITNDTDRLEKLTKEPKCAAQLHWAANNLAEFDTIILAASWDGYVGASSPKPLFEKEILKSIDFLVENKKRVVILELVPDCPDLPSFYRTEFSVRKKFTNEMKLRKSVQATCNKATAVTNPYLKTLAEQHHAIFVPALADFQNQVGPLPFVGEDYYYKDGSHLNQFGSTKMGKWTGLHSENFKFLSK